MIGSGSKHDRGAVARSAERGRAKRGRWSRVSGAVVAFQTTRARSALVKMEPEPKGGARSALPLGLKNLFPKRSDKENKKYTNEPLPDFVIYSFKNIECRRQSVLKISSAGVAVVEMESAWKIKRETGSPHYAKTKVCDVLF